MRMQLISVQKDLFMENSNLLATTERIENCILVIRNQKAILDADLAMLYGVTTKRLNEQVKRNKLRFPSDFIFKLNSSEKNEVVAKCDHLAKLKHSKAMPYAFTEHGAIMVASVLNSQRAVEVSVYVIRAFVKLRKAIAGQHALTQKLVDLEGRLDKHDEAIQALIQAIHNLMETPKPNKRAIGFHANLLNSK